MLIVGMWFFRHSVDFFYYEALMALRIRVVTANSLRYHVAISNSSSSNSSMQVICDSAVG